MARGRSVTVAGEKNRKSKFAGCFIMGGGSPCRKTLTSVGLSFEITLVIDHTVLEKVP